MKFVFEHYIQILFLYVVMQSMLSKFVYKNSSQYSKTKKIKNETSVLTLKFERLKLTRPNVLHVSRNLLSSGSCWTLKFTTP